MTACCSPARAWPSSSKICSRRSNSRSPRDALTAAGATVVWWDRWPARPTPASTAGVVTADLAAGAARVERLRCGRDSRRLRPRQDAPAARDGRPGARQPGGRQARRRHLPRPVGAHQCQGADGQDAHLLAVDRGGREERRWPLRRPAGRGRRQPDHLAQGGRSARRSTTPSSVSSKRVPDSPRPGPPCAGAARRRPASAHTRPSSPRRRAGSPRSRRSTAGRSPRRSPIRG